jgi:hypothetical protein
MVPSLSTALDERLDVSCQHDHRHVAAGHHGIVELAQIELRAQRLLSLGAQPIDLAVTDLVATRLAGPDGFPAMIGTT